MYLDALWNNEVIITSSPCTARPVPPRGFSDEMQVTNMVDNDSGRTAEMVDSTVTPNQSIGNSIHSDNDSDGDSSIGATVNRLEQNNVAVGSLYSNSTCPITTSNFNPTLFHVRDDFRTKMNNHITGTIKCSHLFPEPSGKFESSITIDYLQIPSNKKSSEIYKFSM